MNKTILLTYLQSHRFMSIATYDTSIWIANVYYVADDTYSLYFLSDPMTEHGKAIKNNAMVACAIADSNQSVTDKKIGVQIRGIAKRIYGIETMKWMLALWTKMNPGYESIINIKAIQSKRIRSRIFKVESKRIKFFHEELYGKSEFEIFEFD